MIVFGHRGAPSLAQENTIESFRLALSHNVDGLEFDVQLTRDSQLIVYHDYDICYQNQNHDISQLLFKEIREMDLGFEIPTLDEVLSICPKDKIINVEIKAQNIIHHDLINDVVHSVEKHNLISSVIVSSFNPFVLLELKKQKPTIKRGQLWSSGTHESWYVSKLANSLLDPYSFHANVNHITPSIREWIKKQSLKLYLYTINNLEQLAVAKELKVDGVFSDYPNILDSKIDNKSR
tara:strand:+ start:251 stop:958 length:708 start_codon:yes stop_codon:yes gene_type:complete